MRAAVYHELGQALDRSGHYDRAWRAFESASLARQKDPAWMAMNPATALARIEAARAVLDQGFLAGCPPRPARRPRASDFPSSACPDPGPP
jgi:hypothetical protein